MVLQWARANGCLWDETTYEAAVARGHLDVVQWAKENDCPGAVQVRLGLDETGNLSSLAGSEQTFDVHDIIHDWADTNSADHMSYDQAVALVSSKGHTLETLHACLEEYRSLEIWTFTGGDHPASWIINIGRASHPEVRQWVQANGGL